MAWQEAVYKLTSLPPGMLMHNGQTADPTNRLAKQMKQVTGKRKKTDADYEELARLEFYAGLYMNGGGPIIPADNIEAMVIEAAKKTREGKIAKAGVFCVEYASLKYDGPRTAEELWGNEDFRHVAIVRVQSSRVARTRPIFPEWAATVKLQWEDSVTNLPRVDDWMFIAGTQVGLGDWRPKYGRFDVERISD